MSRETGGYTQENSIGLKGLHAQYAPKRRSDDLHPFPKQSRVRAEKRTQALNWVQ